MPSEQPTVYVCSGSDCRRAKGYHKLVEALEPCATVEFVRCQKICSGPVVGMVIGSRLQWLRKLRKRRHRDALADWALTGRLKKRLKKRRVKRRAGKMRGRVR